MPTLKLKIIINILPTDRPEIITPTARTTKKLSCHRPRQLLAKHPKGGESLWKIFNSITKCSSNIVNENHRLSAVNSVGIVNQNFCKLLHTKMLINPFSTNVPLLYPLQTSENRRSSDVFKGYSSGTLVENGLIYFTRLFKFISSKSCKIMESTEIMVNIGKPSRHLLIKSQQ